MKIKFLRKDPENMRLILIFTGWSTGPEVGAGIDIPGWDVAVAYDFTELNPDTSFLDSYYTVYLFGWSLGVFAASRTLPHERITAAFAVNGTTDPVNDIFGIPMAIYNGTAENLNERNLMKFRIRMMRDRTAYEKASALFPDNGNAAIIDNLRDQLIVIRNASAIPDFNLPESTNNGMSPLPWVRAYISKNDRIFPPDNLRREWDGHNRIRTIASGHMPDWQVLIEQEIIDKRLVGEKFSKSASRYDDNASVQREIAHHLHTLWLAHTTESPSSILEIGYGTGFLTALYATSWPLADLSLWDLAPQPVKGIPANTNITACDGEKLIADVPDDTFDVITSASCIQWFQSLPKFLYHAARVVKSRGLIVLSTFGPQNIAEVSEVTHLPLRYYSADELRAMIPENCDVIALEESEMKLNFPSPRHVMSHLRNTGVNALRHTAMTVTDFTRGYPVTSSGAPLTYRPIYIIIKKRSNE